MKIERVILTNFRQYFGEQFVKLSQDPQRNVTIFHGVNGAGKTSFFTALNWCLYGEGVDNIGQIISKEAVRQAEVGHDVYAKVVVTFIHEGQRYVASRQLKGIKQANGSVQEQRDIEFLLMQTRYDGQSSRVDNPIGRMNAILPGNVRTYFLFDGEKIDNFARPESADEVRFAIYQVLNLEVLTRAKRHLAEAARDLRSELKGLVTGEVKTLLAKDEEARAQETALKQRQESLKSELTAASKHIDEVNQQLRELESVQALQRQYDLYDSEMKEREQERLVLVSRIRDLVSQSYISLISDALTKAQALLDEKRQKGEIPSGIRQQFVQDLLTHHMCVCGRPFAAHDNVYHHLHRLLNSAVPSALEDDVLMTSGNLPALLERGQTSQTDLNAAMAEKVRIEHTLTRLHAQRDDVEREMKGTQHLEVNSLLNKRDSYQVDIDTYRTEQVRIEMQLEDLKKQIVEFEKQIAQARKTEHREQLLGLKVELAQRASDAIGDVYESFAEEKRKQIETRTREVFHALAWKGDHFSDVRLTEEYQLEVIDRYGLFARPELSAGERQVLSLSFIASMAQVAEREAPLVMDTPFGRLSSDHRESITAHIPKLASQLILFVTDEELRDQALDNLRNRIGAEYTLHFNGATSCTTIEEVRP